MNTLSKYVLLLLVSVLAACGSDDDAAATFTPETPQPGDALAVTITASDFVTDGDPDTRATDKGPVTTFEDGDRVGIIILDNNKQPLYNNIPYKYVSSNQTWVAADTDKGACYYDPKAYTYIVYYPYSANADGCKNESDLKAIFKPQTDQSRKEAYRASDLMVSTTTSVAPKTSLTAELKHVYASISLAPTAAGADYVLEDGVAYSGKYKPNGADISNFNLTVDDDIYVLHQAADDTWRCILPAGSGASGEVRCFYTIGSKTYGYTIAIANASTVANTRYTSSPKIKRIIYSLNNAHVGDFYCINDKKEGYLIPGDVTDLTNDQKTACLGIVIKVGKDDSGSWKDDCQYKLKDNSTAMNTIHGYVLALHKANGGKICQWGSDGLVNTNTEQYTGFYGYKNTQTITKYDSQHGSNLQNNFPATYHATIGYENQYSAPTNSSGWFLPSVGQCWYWHQNRDAIWTSMEKAGGDEWSTFVWSSSESDFDSTGYAWYVDFGFKSVRNGYRSNRYAVRSCLAF